jgi:hypothetical protein
MANCGYLHCFYYQNTSKGGILFYHTKHFLLLSQVTLSDFLGIGTFEMRPKKCTMMLKIHFFRVQCSALVVKIQS